MAMSAWKSIPHLAHDTDGDTGGSAPAVWAALNRPNVFIKVPATVEGLPAIQQLISEGISVNVTLLFGIAALPAGGGGLPERHRSAGGPRQSP